MGERPCKYCVANWIGMSRGDQPIMPTPTDCQWAHRDEQRIYDLSTAFARVFCGERKPTDEHVGWYLEDAEQVVDDFDPTPDRWRVRRLPASANDGPEGIEVRLRINDVTYVCLEGGKGDRGSVVRLATFRQWHETAPTR